MWLPSVIASTPAANSSSATFGVIPSPPATFSPLTTTNVGSWRSRSTGRHSSSVSPPDAADEIADEQDPRRAGARGVGRARFGRLRLSHTLAMVGEAA